MHRLTGAGKRVILVGTAPEQTWRVPEVVALHNRFGRRPPEVVRADVEARNHDVDAVLTELDAEAGVDVVRLYPLFCPTDTCEVAVEGHPLYSDAYHVSVYGSEEFLASKLASMLDLSN